MLYYDNEWKICPFIAHYRAYGKPEFKYTHDKQWWIDFVSKWWHHENLTFQPVTPTQEQLARLDEINAIPIPEGFKSGASTYVETGLLPRDENGDVLPQFSTLTEQPDPTNTTLLATYRKAVGEYLDGLAQERDYESILTLCSYAASSSPARKAEGDAGVVCRDAAWDHVDQVLADVVGKVRPAPTVDELLAELPTIAWPEE